MGSLLPIVTIAGGVILILGRVGRYGWVVNAFVLAGAVCVAHGVLSLLLQRAFTEETQQLIRHFKTLLGGVAVGILVTIAVAGEFRASRFRKWER